MSFKIQNISAGSVDINDLGLTLAPSQIHDLREEPAQDIAMSNDLPAEITAGNIVVLDPADGVTVLSTARALVVVNVANDPHYRINGAVISDLEDVDSTGIALNGLLQWNNTEFVPVTLGDLADDLEGLIDHNNILNIGSNTHAQIDTHIASTTNPHSTSVDNLTNTTITSPVNGEVLTYNGTIWVNQASAAVSDLATVFVGINANLAIPLSFTDLVWTSTHIENDTAVIEHDNVNPERILIKETGLYFINFSMSFDADPGEETITGRVFKNGTTVIPGSIRVASEDDEINDLSNAFTAELVAGDYITFQHQASGTGNALHSSSNFCVTRARGSQGATGAAGTPGSGTTINVKDDGVNVPNTPHDILNFVGMNATDAGGGQANIQNVYGSNYTYAESLTVTTTNSTSFQEKLKLTTASLPVGTYRIGWSFQWNHDNTGNDFLGRIQMDDTTTLGNYQIEPKDSAGTFSTTGTNQKFGLAGFAQVALTTGVHFFDIDFATENASDESSIWNARLEFWRVS